jgi:hypothetical protein
MFNCVKPYREEKPHTYALRDQIMVIYMEVRGRAILVTFGLPLVGLGVLGGKVFYILS